MEALRAVAMVRREVVREAVWVELWVRRVEGWLEAGGWGDEGGKRLRRVDVRGGGWGEEGGGWLVVEIAGFPMFRGCSGCGWVG